MVLGTLDGNSQGAHVQRDHVYLIYVMHMFRSKEVTNYKHNLFFLTCAQFINIIFWRHKILLDSEDINFIHEYSLLNSQDS